MRITSDNPIRVTRPLFDLVTALNGLNATQKTNISNDLFGGSPAKWTQATGENSSSILVIFTLTQTATLSTADKNLAKIHGTALYIQDYPNYLVNPSFDPTINVPGDQTV